MQIQTSVLQALLDKLSKVVPARSPLPAEMCVRLSAKDGVLIGYAVNTGSAMSLEVSAPCEGDLDDVIASPTLLKIAGSLHGRFATLEVKDAKLVCVSGTMKTKHAISSEQMPSVGFDGDVFTHYGELSGATLSDVLTYAIPLCDNKPGWAITGVVAFSGGFVYTTNGKAAARIVCPDLDKNFTATPPFSAIAILSRIAEGEVAVSRSDRVVLFEGLGFILRTGEVDCQIPDLDGALFAPVRVNHARIEDVFSMRKGIEGCVMFGDATTPARLEMRLEFEPEQVVVCSASDELRLAVCADSNFSDVIAFNSRYLLAAIKAMGNSFDVFALNAVSPVLFRGDACDYVLFPMRL